MTLERLAWLLTVGIGLVGALLFFLSGFQGYGTLAALLAIAASVNLGPGGEGRRDRAQ